ncbi:MAG: N-6 DNA methylase [Candidatus Hydrogenedentes bacterium]|nr:N-6 DNA methylase [Candidatus Hydrogenedentota bacterium]
MLDTDTKRRIDTARDILVGKVPDPKSQVEQITIALIYKFMDDMDAESEELGGKRKFFAGPFKKYGWAQLMRSGLGGHEALERYSEAITRMPENPGIPPLFRDIFKNAYLPYRDPETLRAFLKIIDEFNYDHSERLGDAFEYLLSVLGSQGDAGQFRTPRHIIDFMVEITAPQKHETILDPACGTAGFLISAYKHILRNNVPRARGDRSDRSHRSDPSDPLTPDEKAALAQNLTGYDISPDMVRLSLVNLYLHGFTDPHIHEYDTLTSQDRWNEYADVILANPPFMSPKGGIRPHNRFSVQSKRSEVLFVDYMAEHLTPDGRAAIIVPEGIIFQSQNAYKQLRKLLVEEYLIAVVSLPAGVFQPYSGVKTSILVLDKKRARRCRAVAFFKIENDGFGLGAQRRPIDKNDLPAAVAAITKYKERITNGEDLLAPAPSPGATPAAKSTLPNTTARSNPSDRSDWSDPSDPSDPAATPVDYLIVPKEKIAANGDYNLSGERYRENDARASHYPIVTLGEVCELIGGGTPSKQNNSYWQNGSIKWISSKYIGDSAQITGYELISKKAVEESSTKMAPKNSTIIITRVSVGKFAFADDDYAINQDLTAIVSKDTTSLAPEFIRVIAFHIASVVEQNAEGIGVRGVTRKFLSELQIPLPPISVQQEIVAEIEGYQNVINGARAVLDNYRPHIPIHPDWPMVELGEVFETKSGTTPSRNNDAYFVDGTIPWVKTLDLSDGSITRTQEAITPLALDKTHLSILPVGTVLIAMYGGFNQIGRTGVLEIEATHNQAMTALLPSQKVNPYFLNFVLTSSKEYWKTVANSTRKDPNITKSDILRFKFPLPPIATQQAIVAEIEAEQALVHANRELIERMERKIQATLGRVWGED